MTNQTVNTKAIQQTMAVMSVTKQVWSLETIEKTVTHFATALGNGAAMAKHFKNAMDYVISERDTTPIVRMYQAAKRRGDDKSALVLLSTFKKIFVGATETRKGGRVVGLKIKEANLSNAAVSKLHDLVQDKISMRGSKFVDAFKTDAEASKPKAFDAAKWGDTQSKGKTKTQIDAMIAALVEIKKKGSNLK